MVNGIDAIEVPYTGIVDYKAVSEKYAEKIPGGRRRDCCRGESKKDHQGKTVFRK